MGAGLRDDEPSRWTHEAVDAGIGRRGTPPWGPYWDILFPPAMVTGWINWKRMSTGVNVARRLWDQREYLRRTYESVHGDDPAAWPSQHPGVVLDAVLWMAHPACLRCHWFDEGFYMRREGGLLRALDLARRHEVSDGADDSRAIRRPPNTPESPVEGDDP